jgi:hypothetical protein
VWDVEGEMFYFNVPARERTNANHWTQQKELETLACGLVAATGRNTHSHELVAAAGCRHGALGIVAAADAGQHITYHEIHMNL